MLGYASDETVPQHVVLPANIFDIFRQHQTDNGAHLWVIFVLFVPLYAVAETGQRWKTERFGFF